MIGTFLLYLGSAAFVGGLAGTILSLVLGRLDKMTAEQIVGGEAVPSFGRYLPLVLVAGIPAAILAQRLHALMNPWIVFGAGLGAAFVSGGIMYAAGRSQRR